MIDVPEVFLDFLARVGPESRAVRKGLRPEQICVSDGTPIGNAEEVVNERGIELAAKILAGNKRQFGFKCLPINLHATSDETFVQPAQKVSKPSAVKLG